MRFVRPFLRGAAFAVGLMVGVWLFASGLFGVVDAFVREAHACNQTDYDAGRCYDINHCSAQDRHKGYC